MKNTFEERFKNHIRKELPEWGDIWDTELFKGYMNIHYAFPFLTVHQILNLVSYCGGVTNVFQCACKPAKQAFLKRIPAIGERTFSKLIA